MSRKIKKVTPPDSFHLAAAEGWLELGNPLEAQSELERITPGLHAHPLVLELRWKIHAQAAQWEQAVIAAHELAHYLPKEAPGWIHWAYSLHELKRTREAREVLLPVAEQFPDDYIIPYNLACYACQLGNEKEALQWLAKAVALAGKKTIRAMAIDDPDLAPLREKITGI